jgi:hypothetical protein
MISGAVTGTRASWAKAAQGRSHPTYVVRTAYDIGGICPMRLIDAIALINFVDNGWTFAALIVVLAYLYLMRA